MAMQDEHVAPAGQAPRSPAGAAWSPRVTLVRGRYRLLEPIGAGGMGSVHHARDLVTGRSVALKLPRAPAARQPWSSRACLLREGEALARVRHPHVVGFIDVGVDRDVAFLAMQRLHAAPLAGRTLRPGAALRIGRQIGEALAAVHDAGLVHRDVTPRNLLVAPDGHATLIDFGLARAVDATDDVFAALALTGSEPAGTRAYMAPEQRDGLGVTAAADQYALSATLLRGLDVGAAASREDGALAALLAVLRRALAEEPRARFADMRAFVAALGGCTTR